MEKTEKKLKHKAIRVGITHGDCNGIGYEVILKTLLNPIFLEYCIPVVYGVESILKDQNKLLNLPELKVNLLKSEQTPQNKQVNFVNVATEVKPLSLGVSTLESGALALKALEQAVLDLKENRIDVLVTAPINKDTIQSATFKFPGHTEYLANAFETKDYMMLMISDHFKIGTVTGHIPLNQVAQNLSIEGIFKKIKSLNTALIQDFNIMRPKIAVLGLNPHAGDNGLLGKEELEIIQPAIQKAKDAGILAFGPYPADGFFASNNTQHYDAILAMYHDQGLIPFKLSSHHSGVNYTAGLPIIRTSPDHGTGLDIAGKGVASEQAFIAALFTAIEIYDNRIYHKQIHSNPLKPIKLKELKED